MLPRLTIMENGLTQMDTKLQLTPAELNALRNTFCTTCGNRLVDSEGCEDCKAAKDMLHRGEGTVSDGDETLP